MSSHCLQILPRLALLTYLNNEPFRLEREGEERERDGKREKVWSEEKERDGKRENVSSEEKERERG